MTRYVFIFLLGLTLSQLVIADCHDSKPLVSTPWVTFGDHFESMVFGTWALPVSANRPGVLTKARVTASLEILDTVIVRLVFSFLSSEVFGLPFMIEYVKINYILKGRIFATEVDLSHNCTTLGQSFFPGGHISLDVPINALKIPAVVEGLSIQVWGLRN